MGPPLFDIYIDDIELEAILADLLTIFADDTKGLKEITCDNDRMDLQTVLNNLCEWAKKWSMSFNIAKCKIMHVGTRNPNYK
jgi:Reverse transcriptase (RNA-dependent DNA polymerase)